MTTVTITAAGLTAAEVLAIVDGARVGLAPDAVAAIEASRAVVDRAVERGDLVYGVTTMVGHDRDTRVPLGALREMQVQLVETHRGGLGPVLPEQRVRAAMAVRLAGFALGGAGVSLPVARTLAELLDHGIHPVTPDAGSVGSGDLSQLAFLGRTLLGRGEVVVDGEVRPAAAALADAGLRPVVLEPKDGLATMSSNAVALGHAVLLLPRLRGLLDLADLVAACSMEAVCGNPSVLDAVVAGVRDSDGQASSSARIRAALDGSRRTDPAAAQLSVQDPLSVRVVPQVHGAARDAVGHLAQVLDAELAARSDNPLVDVDGDRIISNGNFQPMAVALAAEGVRLALAHVGLLCGRRTGRAWDLAVTRLADPEAAAAIDHPSLLAGLGLRYPSAARATLVRQLAQPVTLDVPPLDLGVEDHSSNLPVALDVTERLLELLEEQLLVELLHAVAVLALDGALGGGARDLGHATGPRLEGVAAALRALPPTSRPDEALAAVRAVGAGPAAG